MAAQRRLVAKLVGEDVVGNPEVLAGQTGCSTDRDDLGTVEERQFIVEHASEGRREPTSPVITVRQLALTVRPVWAP